MKHNVVIAAGSQVFEFEGEILELEDTHILLKAKRGDIFIERQYLVFIQALNEMPKEAEEEYIPVQEKSVTKEPMPVAVRSPKIDQAARFVSQRLKQDPLAEKLEQRLVPPSQLPDDYDQIDEDMEAAKNVAGFYHGPNNPLTRATNLKQAAQIAMNNDSEDFSMGMGTVEYKNPLQIALGMGNAHKKTRTT